MAWVPPCAAPAQATPVNGTQHGGRKSSTDYADIGNEFLRWCELPPSCCICRFAVNYLQAVPGHYCVSVRQAAAEKKPFHHHPNLHYLCKLHWTGECAPRSCNPRHVSRGEREGEGEGERERERQTDRAVHPVGIGCRFCRVVAAAKSHAVAQCNAIPGTDWASKLAAGSIVGHKDSCPWLTFTPDLARISAGNVHRLVGLQSCRPE